MGNKTARFPSLRGLRCECRRGRPYSSAQKLGLRDDLRGGFSRMSAPSSQELADFRFPLSLGALYSRLLLRQILPTISALKDNAERQNAVFFFFWCVCVFCAVNWKCSFFPEDDGIARTPGVFVRSLASQSPACLYKRHESFRAVGRPVFGVGARLKGSQNV